MAISCGAAVRGVVHFVAHNRPKAFAIEFDVNVNHHESLVASSAATAATSDDVECGGDATAISSDAVAAMTSKLEGGSDDAASSSPLEFVDATTSCVVESK